MNRINIETYLRTVQLKNNQNRRLTCPLCQGHNTFSVSKENGVIKYFCFRAVCGLRGIISGNRDSQTIREIIKGQEIEQKEFEIPWYFSSIANHEKAYEYAKRSNCLEVYYDRACNLYFDPRTNRIVFTIRRRSNGVCVDAAGRYIGAFTPNVPKWWRYNSSNYPFIVGSTDVAIIVEDCISACAVYNAGYTGVALLGTNLKEAYLSELKGFSECILALDPDAARKSLQMIRRIEPYVPNVKVRLIKDDLKYFNKDQIREQLK